MGIFRPNKLGYTSEDVEKKSNSYIMTLVEKFVTNITDIVNGFKKDINTAVEVQNNEIDGISERLNQEIVLRDNEDNSLKKDVQDLNSELFNLDGKYKNITDKIIDDLDTERLQREGVNTGQIGDNYIIVTLQTTLFFFYSNAGPVAHILLGASQLVKQGSFATVGITN